MTPALIALVLQYAHLYNLPPEIVFSVIEVESSWNVHAKGKDGEIGLFQIMPSNFRYVSSVQLYAPSTNIALGVALLAQAKQHCRHKSHYSYVVCYNKGVPVGNKVKRPLFDSYYIKVMIAYKKYTKKGVLGASYRYLR